MFLIMKNNICDTVVRLLHNGENPWTGYKVGTTNFHNSWGSTEPCFEHFIKELRPQLVIEVGSFLGGSAIHMADMLEESGLENRCIICVDTWLAEEVLWSRPDERKLLKIEHGSPTFYYTFLNNVEFSGHSDTIIPLRMPSLSAGRYLKMKGIRAPFIYIDGSHIQGDVWADLNMYWDLLLPGGVMLIDDFSNEENGIFDGVIKDATTFAAMNDLKLEVWNKKAFIRKP